MSVASPSDRKFVRRFAELIAFLAVQTVLLLLTACRATTQATEEAPVKVETLSADTAQAGKALYQQVCQVCHATGALNAPKFGDKAAWAPRLKKSVDTLYNNAIHGIGAHPPRGASDASDDVVKASTDYMVKAVAY